MGNVWGWVSGALALGLCMQGCVGARGSAPAITSPAHSAPAAPHSAQVAPPPDASPSPMNPEVRTGRLANGLTYYVLEHKKPQQRAALWLAVNTGSVLEDDDQRGLAHFVEHMAFNGTKRFPRLAIVDLLEKAGMVFGADLNAHTTFDQTVYQLTVPTDQPQITTNALNFLRDVAGDISFDAGALEKERSVVLEEWRLGRGAAARIGEKELPLMLHGSRYAERNPIGLPEVLKTASPDLLRRFYQDWYRPDLMAVIAVGDFDGAGMEAEIKARFADLTRPDKPRPRLSVSVPHDAEPAVSIETDPEQLRTIITSYEKVDHRRRWSKSDYRSELVEHLYTAMLSDRLWQLRDNPNSPWVAAQSGRYTIVRSLDAFTNVVTCREGRFGDALSLLYRELQRASRDGFLPTELDRARKTAIARNERLFLEHDNSALAPLANEITRNFFEHEQMPGPAVELAWTRELLPSISLAEVNILAREHASPVGKGLVIKAPANVALPTVAQVSEIARTALQTPLPAWVDTSPTGPLVPTPPAPGRVVTTAHDTAADATIWTLANGVRVVVKPTTFRNDSVTMTGWQSGGASLVPEADANQLRFAQDIVAGSGAGQFSARDLHRLLAGKTLTLSLSVGELDEWVNASARPQDLETMLQVLYLRFTKPNRNTITFETWQAKTREAVRHRSESPEVHFLDEVARAATGDAVRARPVTVETVDDANLDRAYALWKERFSDFGGYTFVFIGNIDTDKLKPWVETYLGSLPSKPTREHWQDEHIAFPTGIVERSVEFGREPKSYVWLGFGSKLSWSQDTKRDAQLLEALLRIRLREILRDDLAGIYNVTVTANVLRMPIQRQRFDIFFGCAPENVDRLRKAVFAELASIAKNGIAESYLAKVKEQFRRRREVDVRENLWWITNLRDAYYYGDNFADLTNLDALLARATSDHVRDTARRTFDPKQYIAVTLRPAPTAANSAPVVAPTPAPPALPPPDADPDE